MHDICSDWLFWRTMGNLLDTEIVTSESHKRLHPTCLERIDLSAAHGTFLKTDLRTYSSTPEWQELQLCQWIIRVGHHKLPHNTCCWDVPKTKWVLSLKVLLTYGAWVEGGLCGMTCELAVVALKYRLGSVPSLCSSPGGSETMDTQGLYLMADLAKVQTFRSSL